MKNSKKTKNMYKRVAAGALSMALVAGAMPANVGGFLTGGKGIVAHAETAYTAAENHVGLKLNVGDSFVIPESTSQYGSGNMILWDRSTYDIGTQARTITVVRGDDGALKLDGVKQNFTYPKLESSTDQLCIIEYDNYSGWYLCALARCNAFTGVTSVDEINLYGDTIDGCDVTKVENHMSDNCNVTISNIESGKKVRLTYSDNTTNDIEPTEGTVTFTSALYTDYADENNKKVNSVEIVPIPTDLTAGTDYTAPTGSNLNYTGNEIALLEDGNTGSVTVDSNTGEPVGTMQYAIGPHIDTNERVLTTDELKVGTILQPTTETGFTFPENVVVKEDTLASPKRSFKLMWEDGSCKMDFIYAHAGDDYRSSGYFISGINAIRIDSIDDNGMLSISGINTADLIPTEWANDVPKAKEIGDYSVYYYVKGDANHNDTAPAFVTSTIEYATASLTLSPSLTGAVIVENGATEALEATDGVYTLAGTKKYNIYTNKSIADSTAATALDLTSKSSNKTFGGNTYSYRYEIEVPTTPAEGGYILSHTNNYVGKVSTEVGKANVMNIQEDGVTTEDVVTLNADGVIYYGDQLDAEELVTIAGGYSNIVNVDEIYIANTVANGGGRVNIDNLTLNGTYVLTAKVTTDTSGDKTDDDTSGNTVYLKQTITFKARPMNKNDYFLQTEDGLVPLEVSDGTVTVPENYWVCTLIEGGSNSYIRTEEPDEAINAIFNCTKKSTFVYNSKAQKPVIVVKNGGDNSIVLADTAVAANETATPPVAAVAKDYNNAVAEKTDAGSYSYALTAEANGNYSDSVTVKWTIGKADISDYITVAPKNNADTDGNKETLEAVVYDGAVLDGSDFVVSTNEAYTQLAADSPVKKLVDEFIAQLTAAPATETTPAVAAKTTVDVAPAKVEKTTETEYEASDYTGDNGVTLDENNYTSFIGKIVNGNLNLSARDTQKGWIRFYFNGNVRKTTNIIGKPLTGETYTLSYSNNSLSGYDLGVSANEGYLLAIDNIELVENAGADSDRKGYDITFKGVPASTTSLTDANVIDANKDGEVKKANVTVSNSNFKSVKIEGVDVEIAKRDVTLTPDEDLSMTYRDTAMPDLTYSIEDAKADGLTGVVAADKALFQKTTGEGADAVTTNTGAIYVDELVQEDTTAAAVNFVYALDENNATDYTTAGLNNAGSYKYAVINDAKFDNYNIVLPVDIAADEAQGIEEYTAPTFTVAPLNLNNIADLQIVLNGVTPGWTQNGNSGSYTYDGTTKAVEVKKVAKAAENTALSTVVIDSEWVRTESRNFAVEKEDVKLAYRSMNSNTGTITVSNDGYNDLNAILTANSGKVIKSVSFGIENFGRQNNAPLAEGTTAADIVSNEGGVFDPDTNKLIFNDIESDTFTLSAMNGYKLTISSVEITYGDDDVFVLSRDTDYIVGGATKRASAGTHEVQVMGKGNYTGVAKAPWEIVTAEAGEAALTLSGATTDSSGSYDYTKVYDGKAVTGAVTFTDPASDYAVDAEVEYKYYRGRYTKEQVTAADFNAAAIDAPVNAYYPNPAGDNYYPHAGEYTVVATITCDGYADQVLVKTVHIAPIDLTVNAAAKNITYGDDLPAVTQADIDAIVGLTDDDSAYFQKFFTEGKLKFRYLQTGENTYDNNKIQIIPIISTEEEISAFRNVVYNYNTANFYWNVTEKAKSIKDSSINVEFTEGDTAVINPDGTFASESAIKVYDTAILGQDGMPTELTELGENNAATADYELTVESTATEGVYTLELIGKNNYRGVRKIQFKAITEAQNATKFTTNVDIAVNPNKPDTKYVKYTFERNIADDAEISAAGYVYVKDTVDELNINTVGAKFKTVATTAKNGTVSISVPDEGNGTTAVGFVVVNGEYVYSDVISKTYADVIAEKSNVKLSGVCTAKNPNKPDVKYVKYTFERNVADDVEISAAGYVYVKGTVNELNVHTAGATVKTVETTVKNGTVGIAVPDEGNGTTAVGFVVVNGVYIYSDVVSKTYNEAVLAEKVAVNVAGITTATNPNKPDVKYVKYTFERNVADDVEISAAGYVYIKDTIDKLTVETAGATVKTVETTVKNGTVGIAVPDTGNGTTAVGFVVVNGEYIYSEVVSSTYEEAASAN